jgi:hypothetical protein
MKPCHFAARTVTKTIIAAGVALLTLAAACSSPTSPVADNGSTAAIRGGTAPVAHNACGVYAGSGQC